MTLQKLLMSVLIVMLICTPALAQETKAEPVDKVTARVRCEIIDKELRELEGRMYAARKKIEKLKRLSICARRRPTLRMRTRMGKRLIRR